MSILISGKEANLGSPVRAPRPATSRSPALSVRLCFLIAWDRHRSSRGRGLTLPRIPISALLPVTYLFEGAIRHHDSLGSLLEIQPGDPNWMSAGRGITHSERETDAVRNSHHKLDGLQLWAALPEDEEESDPEFFHIAKDDLPIIEDAGLHMRLIAGEAFGKKPPGSRQVQAVLS